jgi:hypothetical protein
MSLWKTYEEHYDQGNHSWHPCTEEFYYDMLEVLPPVYFPRKTGWGLFAVSEAWKHDSNGKQVYLWLRSEPQFLCRMASEWDLTQELGGNPQPILAMEETK